MNTDRILLGVALMIGFCATAPLIDVASKLATAALPVGEVTTARFIVQSALMAPVCLVMGLGLRLPQGTLGMMTLRAIFLILSTYCFVAAIEVMPIADALAIAFVEPFLLLILGRALFGDEVGPRRIGASIVGFGGSMLVIQPSFAAFGAVAFYPLGTALFFAAYMLATRSLSRRAHPVAMQYHTALLASLICIPVLGIGAIADLAPIAPVMPEGIFWLWLFGVGAAASVSHMMMTIALRFAPSATLAPLHYLEIVSAAVLGYLVFGDFPDALTWTGIGIIVASGLYIVHRERITAKRGSVILPTVASRPPQG